MIPRQSDVHLDSIGRRFSEFRQMADSKSLAKRIKEEEEHQKTVQQRRQAMKEKHDAYQKKVNLVRINLIIFLFLFFFPIHLSP